MNQDTNMYNSEFWANAWNQYRLINHKRHQDPAARVEFWNHFSAQYTKHNDANKEIHQEIINNLVNQKAMQTGDSLLDIGCGPGTYALPLAAKGIEVTGLDTASQMLTALQSQADESGLASHIHCLQADWNDLPSEPAYDITFAAKSPAIDDYESLMKMTRVARKTCCLIGFAGKHDLELRGQLREKLLHEQSPSPSFDIIYPFNILYQEGYRPNLSFCNYSHTEREPLAYLIEHYTRYFAMLGASSPGVEASIREFLQDQAVDGHCIEKSSTTLGVMWWKVN